MLADEAEQRAQIVEVEQQQALVVGDAERHLQHALLHIVQFEHAPEQVRTHLGNGGAHRVAALTIDVPEHDRIGLGLPVGNAELGDARLQLLTRRGSGLAEAGEIALHVGEEDRNAQPRESLREHHQRHRLAGAGRAGDQSMAIAVPRQQIYVLFALAEMNAGHRRSPWMQTAILAAKQRGDAALRVASPRLRSYRA